MMNPDLTDPIWLAKREDQWREYCTNLSDELSKRDLGFIRPMFFEEDFDYGNVKKYGKYATDHQWAFVLCPIQTTERWEKWFRMCLPVWLGEKFEENLTSIMKNYAFFGPLYKWKVEKMFELFDFCFGRRVVFGPYNFLEYTLPRHPICTQSDVFYDRWANAIYNWLSANSTSRSGEYAPHITEMWFSILSLVHPVYFSYEMNSDTISKQRCLQRVFALCHSDYSFERLIKNKDSEDPEYQIMLAADKGRREKFIESFKKMMSSEKIPEQMKALWVKSQAADFVPACDLEPTLYIDIKDSVRKTKLSDWTMDRIKEIESTL